ncbi:MULTISPECIES: hypothetical protein [Streptomyces]|uniref:hypothetical protein n=1 Tax=Streptomyces TaxID=1883 RepID=UPI0006C537BA|nr:MULTISPECIES: hypothetical protein [Streptomyces]KOT99243.1 hypothetical protein ADK70_04600 [Streptomyces rimosus subsp. pseudoverticillatus]
MRRRLTSLAVSTALAGGVLFAAVPAQTAFAGQVTCHISQMAEEAAQHKSKAAKLDRSGHHKAANKERAKARAIEKRIAQCQDSEKHNAGHFGG